MLKVPKPKKEDARDVELRALRAQVKRLEGDRHDMHEMAVHLNNRLESERIFINSLVESWMRRGEAGLVELLGQIKDGLAMLPKASAANLIQRQSESRPDTQGVFAQRPAIEGRLV